MHHIGVGLIFCLHLEQQALILLAVMDGFLRCIYILHLYTRYPMGVAISPAVRFGAACLHAYLNIYKSAKCLHSGIAASISNPSISIISIVWFPTFPRPELATVLSQRLVMPSRIARLRAAWTQTPWAGSRMRFLIDACSLYFKFPAETNASPTPNLNSIGVDIVVDRRALRSPRTG